MARIIPVRRPITAPAAVISGFGYKNLRVGNGALVAPSPTILGSGSAATPGGGDLSDGSEVTVTGPTSTLPSFREWLGGSGGVIDSGTPGGVFSRTNWSRLDPGLNYSRWFYSTTRTLNRARALMFDAQAANDGRGTYFLDYGASGATQEYSSCNYYWEPGVGAPSGTQWKIRRGCSATDVNDNFDPSWRTTTTISQLPLSTSIYDQDATSHDSSTPGQHWFPGSPFVPTGVWIRVEHWITYNSPAGTANGTYRCKITRCSNNSVVCDQTFTGINFRGNSPAVSAHRYNIFQNFFGNGGTPDHANCKLWMDDIFAQAVSSGVNAFVRAELVNNAVYASATVVPRLCEVISIIGNQWRVKLNGVGTGMWLALFNSSNTPTMVAL